MSLILEALNKADKEREERPAIPNLNSVHDSLMQKNNTSDKTAIYAIGGLLALILVILLIVLYRMFSGPEALSRDTNKVQDEGLAMSVTPPLDVMAESSVETQNIAKPVVPEIEQNKHSMKPVQPTAQESVLPKKKPIATTEKQQLDPEIAAIYAESAALEKAQKEKRKKRLKEVATKTNVSSDVEAVLTAETSSQTDQDALLEAVWEEVKKELPGNYKEQIDQFNRENSATTSIQNQDGVNAYKQVPFLHELPPNFQNKIPSINYSNHIYSNNGSAVILNGQPLKNGESFSGGIAVQKILSDGVILNYQNKPFKLSELSSWVNMD